MLPDIFPLGPFLIEPDGRLCVRAQGKAPDFCFTWRERRFFAVLEEGQIALSAVIGQVPSSASGLARRQSALEALRALPATLPRGWVLRLRPDHRLQLEMGEQMTWPAHISALLQPIIRCLLTLAPYLDLIEEAGLA